MKAVLQRTYGPPAKALTVEDVPKPEVAPDQVLVRVHASSINSGDCRICRADPVFVRFVGGFRRPKNPAFGGDLAGVVEATGANVTQLKPGDQVFGVRNGAVAEYVAATTVVAAPESLTLPQAAAVPITAVTALQALRDQGQLKAGQKVLINGAGGGVGTMAVQIAKALGGRVTAVTGTDKVAMVSGLGPDATLDRSSNDFTKSAAVYDLIVDVSGDHSLGSTRRALKPDGTLVIVGAHKGVLRRLAIGTVRRKLFRQRIKFFIASVTEQDLETIRQLIDEGKVRPVIDRTFPIDQTVAAVEYAEGMQAAGKVVIRIAA